MTKKHKTGLATFRSDILWMCQPFIDYWRSGDVFDFHRGNIIIEPCSEGGVIVVVVTGHAMAIFRDPDGYCSAPMTIDAPDDLFEACQPPERIPFNYCGTAYEMPLPEWAQPGWVTVSSAGVFVTPKIRNPEWSEEDTEFQPVFFERIECGNRCVVGQDYKWSDGIFPWRKPLSYALSGKAQSQDTICVNPTLVSLFQRIHDHAADTIGRGLACYFRSIHRNDDEYQILVTIEDYPNFTGILMPMKTDAYQQPAQWLTALADNSKTDASLNGGDA